MGDSTTQTNRNPADATYLAADSDLERIVSEEERVLARVHRTIDNHDPGPRRGQLIDYDAELIALRDQIREARVEDIPPLVEEMERLQQVSSRRARVAVGSADPRSPYFGRLVLDEDGKKREVLIGRSTYIDAKTGVSIVDWRDAPVSRIYYRYEEGDDFDEVFGDREVEGEVLVRRTLSISASKLRRITAPQGSFRCHADGEWKVAPASATKLSGGQGAAMRPEAHHRPGHLGVGGDDGREDKFLSEVTALIDPVQFELITKPTSGLVVIQGGAGSGKTTIGLHRLAYLAFQDSERFTPASMLVVVFNEALVRYISRVLPALGVEGVPVVTFESWASRLRKRHFPHLPTDYTDDTPGSITRLKKHPTMLHLIDTYGDELLARADKVVREVAMATEGGAYISRHWESTRRYALGTRLAILDQWSTDASSDASNLSVGARHALGRELKRLREVSEDVVSAWADLLTDRDRVHRAFRELAPEAMSEHDLASAYRWCTRRCQLLLHQVERGIEEQQADAEEDNDKDDEEDEDLMRSADGLADEDTVFDGLDREDDALLLRLHQVLRGPLVQSGVPLTYEHIFVDEAQDVSPVELAVVLQTSSDRQSVTLAGDVAQKLYMDNGFTRWDNVLHQLGLDHVAVEPLRLTYRSTVEIFDFANDVLGPLRNEVVGQATRHGAPVEAFTFTDSGEAVGFLSESLRNLVAAEPFASVAVIARYPEQADLYWSGLQRGEVPNLRRIAEQDFPFRPGVDVTDIRQVKGLEFDYVVIVECTPSSFPSDDESRHLLHIAATRAAHQLWIVATGVPTTLLPEAMRDTIA